MVAPSTSISPARRRLLLRRIFVMLSVLSIIINLDGGAVPAGLLHIERTFALGTVQVGLVGMLVYQGIAIGCLVVGPLLRHVSPLRATRVTLILNICATLGFGASLSPTMLLVFRTAIGFLQAIPATYFPVWVDEFAPDSKATLWMAVIQAGAPFGIMLGYVFSGLLASLQGDPTARCMQDDLTCAWRMPFYVQSGVLVLFAVGFFCIPKELYDLGQPQPPAEDEPAETKPTAPLDAPTEPQKDVASEKVGCSDGAYPAGRGEARGAASLDSQDDADSQDGADSQEGADCQDGAATVPEQRVRPLAAVLAIEPLHPISFARPVGTVHMATAQLSVGPAAAAQEEWSGGDRRSSSRTLSRARQRLATPTPRLTLPNTLPDGKEGKPWMVSMLDLWTKAPAARDSTHLSTQPSTRTCSGTPGTSSPAQPLDRPHDTVHRAGTTPARMVSDVPESVARTTAHTGESHTGESTLDGVGDAFSSAVKNVVVWVMDSVRKPEPDAAADGTIEETSLRGREPVAEPSAAADGAACNPSELEASVAREALARAAARRRGVLCELLANGVFCCTVLALSSLFFVVTGIQFW